MSNEIPSFLKKDKDSLLFNVEGELVFYVPETYFESKMAIIVGEFVNLIGVLDYAIFDKNGKHNGLMPFRFPTIFLAKPGVIEQVKNIKLTKTSEQQDYRLLKFRKGDQVIVSTKVPQLVANAEEFYRMFLSGKLPTTISYQVLHEYFLENIRLNGADYGISAQLFGMVVSELCRDQNDITKLYRHTDMSKGYQMISIQSAPKYVSPYTAITSENFDASLVYSMMNKSPKYSPLEKIMIE